MKSKPSTSTLQAVRATEFIFNEIADNLLERLDFIKIKPRRILDIGSRLGYSGFKLKNKFKPATVIALDSREWLLRLTRKKWWNNPLKITAENYSLPFESQSIDLIFSNLYILDLKNLNASLKEFARVLKPEGLFLFSLLGPDTLNELNQSFDNTQFIFTDMHNIGDALLKQGFKNPVMDRDLITLHYSSIKKIYDDIRSVQINKNLNPGLMGKNRWHQMLQNYETLKENNLFPVSLEVIYGLAWAPKNLENKIKEVIIPLSSIPIRKKNI